MLLQRYHDTISAISTPIGIGGIGIIRISGSNSVPIIKKISNLKKLKANTITFSKIVNYKNQTIDDVLISYFKAPNSYTGEDIIEINCHGGYILLETILESCIKNGARLADKGEFTLRAFINGKLDLIQAESVIDLIEAKTKISSKIALSHLEGNLSTEIKGIRKELIQLVSHLEVHLDYPDEEELGNTIDYIKTLKSISSKISNLIESFKVGQLYKDGLRLVITGKPNVGKSSLFNYFLQDNRAIVSSIPGTTRDCLEEWMQIDGIPFRLIDTAGIRCLESFDDEIETIGIERAKSMVTDADLCLLVLDCETGWSEQDLHIISTLNANKTVILLNKIDINNKVEPLMQKISEHNFKYYIPISIEKKKNMNQISKTLKKVIHKMISNDQYSMYSNVLANKRQYEKLYKTKESIRKARDSIQKSIPEDFWLVDLRQAIRDIGEIIGANVSDEVLDNIFSRFCVGK